MSRVAKQPIIILPNVDVNITEQSITIKGPNGTLSQEIHHTVDIKRESLTNHDQQQDVILVSAKNPTKDASAISGTMRSLINNMMIGVSAGFEKILELVGVGYRAKVAGNQLNLTLGFSHPVTYQLPEGVTATTPSNTEISIKGCDKQKVGQVAAEIRKFRPPEPYKGKGVKYKGEQIVRKETKKK